MPYKDPLKQKKSQHDSYLRNKDKVRESSKIAKKKLFHKNKEYIRKAKDVPCLDCETKYPHYVMDFDHIGEKIASVTYLAHNKSLKEVIKEIAKCEIVCANCHRVRTYKRGQHDGSINWKKKRDKEQL
jgi:hypothetical protein